MTPIFEDVVCKFWNIPTYCDKTATELAFSTQASLNKVELLKDCLFFPVHNAKFSDGSTSTMYCPSNDSTLLKTTCEADCNNVAFADLVTVIKISDKEVVRLYQFWMFFLFLIISWIGMAVVVSLGDTICFEMLDRPQLYGQQRMFGSIGWGTFSIIAGLAVDKFSEGQSVKNYTVVFIMTMVLIIFDMLVSARLEHSQTKRSSSIVKDVGKMFKSVRISIFFLWCIVVGLGTALIWNFLFWHLEDLAAASKTCDTTWIKTLQGLAMGIQCFGGELPFFFLSGWLLKKISHVHAMSLVLLGFAFRFYFYSILVNPWWVLPIELLNGVTFGIFYATMASYASIIAPAGCEATLQVSIHTEICILDFDFKSLCLQGLAGGIFEGVGVSLGSLIGGAMFSKIGGSKTFQWFSICAFFAFLVHVLVQFLLKRTSSPGKDTKTNGLNSETMLKHTTPVNKSGGSTNSSDGDPNTFNEINLEK
jgi:MFS family permease